MFKNPLIAVISVVVFALFVGCQPKKSVQGEKVGPDVVRPEPAIVEQNGDDVAKAVEPNETMTVAVEAEETVSEEPDVRQVEEPVVETIEGATADIRGEQPEVVVRPEEIEQGEAAVDEVGEPNEAEVEKGIPDSEESVPVEEEPDSADVVAVEQIEEEPGSVDMVEVEPNDATTEDVNDVVEQVADTIPTTDDVAVEPNEPAETDANDTAVSSVEPNEPNEPDADDVTIPVVEPNEAEVNDVVVDIVEPNAPDVSDANAVTEANDVDPQKKVTFHDKFSWLFKDYVKFKGLVDYKGLTRKQPQLKAVLRELASLDRKEYESWPKADKIAFWINAYNLKMIQIITQHYPIQAKSTYTRLIWGANSIRHIGDDFKAREKFLVMDEEFTLQRIERELFRKEFDDPRIFLAMSQGCVSGPPLSKEPYRGETLDKQLDAQVKRFILDNDLAFKIDKKDGKVYLSMFLSDNKDMYGSEFGKKFAIERKFRDQSATHRAVLNFLTGYLPEGVVSFLETGNYEIKHIQITWTVNGAP